MLLVAALLVWLPDQGSPSVGVLRYDVGQLLRYDFSVEYAQSDSGGTSRLAGFLSLHCVCDDVASGAGGWRMEARVENATLRGALLAWMLAMAATCVMLAMRRLRCEGHYERRLNRDAQSCAARATARMGCSCSPSIFQCG